MKVEVIRNFRNKYSKKRHKKGEILEISETRFKEINSTRHGELVKEIKEEKKEVKKKTK